MENTLPIPSDGAQTTSSHFQFRGRTSTNSSNMMPARHSFQSEADLGHQLNSVPIVRRRGTNETITLRPIAEMPQRPNWQAGAEPGLDPSKSNGGQNYVPGKNIPCQITAVDFTKTNLVSHDLNNETLQEFLDKEKAGDSVCRWINVNGLSWDVIQALGNKYNLSHLALEDILHTNTRTKVEWYKEHLFIVMTLQKLVKVEHRDDDSEDSSESITAENLWSKVHKIMSTSKNSDTLPTAEKKGSSNSNLQTRIEHLHPTPYRTLQRYNGGSNEERVDYMESQSLLKKEDMEVCVEQVSLFVTSRNEIISFFESSAKEIERPIMRRLLSSATMIRQSEDATMVAQGVIDAVVDLAFPVNAAFKNAIDEMELDVLTKAPDKKYANLFYVLKSEMAAMKNLTSPITKMIQTLRNHRTLTLRDPDSTAPTIVKVSEMTNTYLGDVEDHCITIEESLNQMLNSSGEISDLIYNRLNIETNSTMKTLTIATVCFLPLTFLTGYFGMNFHEFAGIRNSDSFFWKIALPVSFAVAIIVMYRDIYSFFTRTKQRRTLTKQRVVREKRQQYWSRR